MKPIYLNLDSFCGTERQISIITKLIRDEFSAGCGNFTGYRFDFGDGEAKEHKRWSSAAQSSVEWIVRSAKPWERVRLFRNALGQLSVQVLDFTRRGVREELNGEFQSAAKIGFDSI